MASHDPQQKPRFLASARPALEELAGEPLSEEEVIEMTDNLVAVVELLLRWKRQGEQGTSTPDDVKNTHRSDKPG